MRIRVANIFPLGAIGIVAGACSSPPQTLANPLDFCFAKAQAMCQVSTVCNVDETGCQMYEDQKCVTDAIDATKPLTRLYNSDNAHACIDMLKDAYGHNTALINFQQIGGITDTCNHVFLGVGRVGDVCYLSYDCESGLVCAPQSPPGDALVCVVPIAVAQGQSCATPGSQCPANTYCANQKSGAWLCAPAGGPGQPCNDTSCNETQHCVGGSCQPRGEKGAPCVKDADCAADFPYCDPFASVCAVGLTFAPGAVDCRGTAGLVATPPAPTPVPTKADAGAPTKADAGAPTKADAGAKQDGSATAYKDGGRG